MQAKTSDQEKASGLWDSRHEIWFSTMAAFLMLLSGVSGFVPNALAKEEAAAEDGKPIIAYVAMDPIILPIIDRDGISQTISIVISLQVEGEAMAEEVESNLPRLADAYLSDMYQAPCSKESIHGGWGHQDFHAQKPSEVGDQKNDAGWRSERCSFAGPAAAPGVIIR